MKGWVLLFTALTLSSLTASAQESAQQVVIKKIDMRGALINYPLSDYGEWFFTPYNPAKVGNSPCFKIKFHHDEIDSVKNIEVTSQKNIRVAFEQETLDPREMVGCIQRRTSTFSLGGTQDGKAVKSNFVLNANFAGPQIKASAKCKELGVSVVGKATEGFFSFGIQCPDLPKENLAAMTEFPFAFQSDELQTGAVRIAKLVYPLKKNTPVTHTLVNPQGKEIGSFTLNWNPPAPEKFKIAPPKNKLKPITFVDGRPKPTGDNGPIIRRKELTNIFTGVGINQHQDADAYAGSTATKKGSDLQIHIWGEYIKRPKFGGFFTDSQIDTNVHADLLGKYSTNLMGNVAFQKPIGTFKTSHLFLGLGLSGVTMLGKNPYGGISHGVGASLNLKLEPLSDFWEIATVLSGSSTTNYWVTLTAMKRFEAFRRIFFLGLDVNLITVPTVVSQDPIQYSYRSIALMVGFQFGK